VSLQLTGYDNPINGILVLVRWQSRSLAECLTLQLSRYRCPIIGIPFTAVFVMEIIVPLIRPRKSGLTIPRIFLALKYLPHMASGIWGTPTRNANFWAECNTC